MQDVANFIGELGGDGWTTQAVALILTGVLALTAAVVTAVVTAKQGRLNRLQATRVAAIAAARQQKMQARQDWWEQFAWAAERLWGDDENSAALAAIVLKQLEDAPWASLEDRDLVTLVLERINSDVSDADIEEVPRGQDNQG